MRRWLQYGGFAAGIILIAFGAVAIFMGASGRSTVRDNLRQEQIVGSPDMTPALIAVGVKEAGLKNVDLPTCSVAGKAIATGADARCFASYIRIHALESSGGETYSTMARLRLGRRQGHERSSRGAQERLRTAARQSGALRSGSARRPSAPRST